MRGLLDASKEALKEFLLQRDDHLLVIGCADLDVPILLKVLDALDNGESSDLFWTFGVGYTQAKYATDVVTAAQAKIEAVQEMQRKENVPVWPDLPARVLDEALPVPDRIRDLACSVRDLRSDRDGQRLVWVLLPTAIPDPIHYAQFVRAFLEYDPTVPWWRQMRIVVRDPSSNVSTYAGIPGVRYFQADFSTPRLEKAIEEDAWNGKLDVSDRMQALLQLACLDYSHRRYEDAAEKYHLLLRYYTAVDAKPLMALVLNGLGEVTLQTRNSQLARDYFESALTPALDSNSFPVLLNITINLGNLAMAEQRWKEAEEYYTSAAQISGQFLMAKIRIRCLENAGESRYQLGDTAGAISSWEEAVTLARSVEEPTLLRECLERLRAIYGEHGLGQRRDALDRELAGLGGAQPAGVPS